MSMELLTIAGVPTNTAKVLFDEADALVLIVPGNPGVARLYLPFVQKLAELGQGRLSVAVAGHAGHAPGYPSPQGSFDLANQRRHHLQFLATLPEAATIHVVGHSIGAWLGLRVFDALAEAQRGRALLLFPTIERMADTAAAARIRPLLGPLRGPTILATELLRRLPGRDRLLVRWLLSEAPEPERVVYLAGLLEPTAVSWDNILRLAREELATVVELPEALLDRHADRLTLYYGQDDTWNLPDMSDGVQAKFPEAEVVRCPDRISHSFVFDGSAAMATFVAQRLLHGAAR